MADIFISYASSDPDGPPAVARALEEAGLSVWWDRHLVSGERFQESIVRELSQARAVVVLWSPASIVSDWVYSEARRANDQKKLVQLRSRELTIDDLPAPFDAYHCPFADDLDSLLRAVDQILGLEGRRTPVAPQARASAGPEPTFKIAAPRSQIVGREAEVAELCGYLDEGDRLVTLTGPGGSGKTRLAVEVARSSTGSFRDGVALVPLASAAESAEAWGAIAKALDLPAELDGQQDVVAWLGDRRMLLVLDNLEQLDGAADLVDTVLEETAVAVIATSRRALHVSGEREHAVPPLSLPSGSDLDAIAGSGAVELFVQLAQRARRDFRLKEENASDVARLCAKLDGLPLAIELVAARAKMLSPGALLQRVGEVLDLAATGSRQDGRQSTIRETVGWSYNLLAEPQQRLLDSLGVFEAGAELDALDAVATEDVEAGLDLTETLFELVDASLVQVSEAVDGEPRFALLETVRMFALDRLQERGVLDARKAAHAQYYYDLAGRLFTDLQSAEHRRHRAKFLAETDNLRAVLERGAPGVVDASFYAAAVPASHVACLIGKVSSEFGRVRDAYALLSAAAEQPGLDPYGEVALRRQIGRIRREWGMPDVKGYLETTLAMARALPPAELPPWVDPTEMEFQALFQLMTYEQQSGDRDVARSLCAELGAMAPEGSLEHQAMAHEAWHFQALADDDFELARESLERLREITVEMGDGRYLVLLTVNLACVDLHQGLCDDAARRMAAASEEFIALGDERLLTEAVDTFGEAVGFRHPSLCARAWGAVDTMRETLGIVLGPDVDRTISESSKTIPDQLAPEAWAAAMEEGRSIDLVTVMRELAETVRSWPPPEDPSA